MSKSKRILAVGLVPLLGAVAALTRGRAVRSGIDYARDEHDFLREWESRGGQCRSGKCGMGQYPRKFRQHNGSSE